MNTVARSLAVLGLSAFTASASAAVITNTGPENTYLYAFAETNTATYGQTFTVGTDRYLTSFTLSLFDLVGPSLGFRGYLYAWDGTRATGSQLFSSTTQYLTTTGDFDFTFGTGYLELVAGQQYVAFLSTSELSGTEPEDSYASMRAYGYTGSSIEGGRSVFLNNGNILNDIYNYDWQGNSAFDMKFTAVLAADAPTNDVPEPGTFALIGLGLAGLLAARRKKA